MRPEFHICEDKFVTDRDLSHAKGNIFFPLTDCSGVTAPRYTEYTDTLIHWIHRYTESACGPNAWCCKWERLRPLLLVCTWSQNSWFPTNLKRKVCGSVKKLYVLCLVTQSSLTLCDPMDYSRQGFSVHGDSPGKNTGVGCHVFLQRIFPTQGLNPGLLHCRRILYCLSHQGSPRKLEWVAYPFSRRSSWPSNRTRISLIAGGLFTSWASREAPNSTVSKRLMFEYCPNWAPKNLILHAVFFIEFQIVAKCN